MKIYKIIKIYTLEAESKTEAIKKFQEAESTHTETEYLQTQVTKEVQENGWVATAKQQLFGK